MKKIISIILSVCMLAALSVGSFAFAAGEAIAIPEDGSAATLPVADGEPLWGYGFEHDVIKGEEILSSIPGDAVIWKINVAKAGNYKVEVPVASMTGSGVIGLYINDTKVYTTGNFEAAGYGDYSYNNTAVLYFNAAEAGEYELKIVFESVGAYAKAPTVSFFDGEIPESKVDQTIILAACDAYTNNATQSALLSNDNYYSWHINTAAAFKGFLLPQWTPGGGKANVVFDVMVYAWTESFEDTIATEPVVKTTLTTPGDCVMVCDFEKEIPAGNYLIYIECTDIQGEYTGHSDMHMKTGIDLFEDLDTWDYIEVFTDVTEYKPYPDRTVALNLIVGPDVDTTPENFFLELDPLSVDDPEETEAPDEDEPTETEAPEETEAPTEKPATSKPSNKPAVQTKAPAASDDDEGGYGLVIGIAVGVAVIAIAAVVVVVIKKKK